MAKGPEDKRKRLRSIEGGLAGTPRTTPDTVQEQKDSFEFKDLILIHSETAQRIVDAFARDPERATHELPMCGVEVKDTELVQTMNDWQNYPDKNEFDKVCVYAREYLRRVEAGIISS